jgi:NADPH:quinone reductase-like Zn-dependent oxidoreductase
LTEPSHERAAQYGVRALRYTVEANGCDLADMASLVVSGQVKPHVQKQFALEQAAEAQGVLEHGGSVGKIVLSVS